MTKSPIPEQDRIPRLTRNHLVPGPLLSQVEHPEWRQWRQRLFRLLAILAILAGLVAFHRPLLSGFANLFRIDNPAPSDAIVLLLGGGDHRPIRAAQLYRDGIAPTILLGTAESDSRGLVKETRLTVEILLKLGVPRNAIEVLPGIVTSTKEEATAVGVYAKSHPMRRITVVTTSFHTSRARWIFRKVLGDKDLDIRMAAMSNPAFNETDWYRSDEGLVTYFNEAIKIVYYRIRY
jgi:uncharacterized SAM-binding protein YcdF (DUF218 family)